MSGPLDENNIHRYLAEFADGELDAVRSMEVIRHLAAHPEALEMVEQHWRIRTAARRTILEQTPEPPSGLRGRITVLASQPRTNAGDSQTGSMQLRAPSWARIGLAAAMALGVGGLAGHYLTRSGDREPSIYVNAVPATVVSAVTKIHVDCSRMAAMHNAPFPPQFKELATDVSADLRRDEPYPDLAKVGYELVGAGPCAKPLDKTVHLLYRSRTQGVSDTLSVFVQPYNRSPQIELNKSYLVTDDLSAHPMYVWRSDKVVYFLVGDDIDTVAKARGAVLGSAANTRS